jgi:hypothetical protein
MGDLVVGTGTLTDAEAARLAERIVSLLLTDVKSRAGD